MKTRFVWLTLCLPLVLAQPSLAQTMKRPVDPGMEKPPVDSGAIVTPPPVNDKSVATPPKNIDPKIDDRTDDIDRANKKKSDDKKKRSTRRKESAPLSKSQGKKE